ncbi:ATP synthase F0 subunit C [Desulfosarcina sp. OttesenSCG-928-A07]|nr:ATP synthase F0 subunit C [Desulfosarcina sp. OttesenSCG-928-G17]MDL2328270.1 ATP synthase F0 subunit C [Desulfosarcina sp. OttesenSCG-928-A07]
MDIETCVKVASFLGAGAAMGFGAIGSAVCEGYTAAAANTAISRNPNATGDILTSMLVGQAVTESASIFSLVIAMILLFTPFSSQTLITAAVVLSAGICMGTGALGSGMGSGVAAAEACHGIARQPGASDSIRMNMLVGTAVSQTPAIFALVTSLILLLLDYSSHAPWPTIGAILGAGLASGLGAIGSGVGDGLVASAASRGVARQPEAAGTITKMMLVGQAVTETTAIYGLLISFILMFGNFPATDQIAPGVALFSAGLCMGIGALGPGIGEGLTARNAVDWMSRNSKAIPTITRVMLVGQAVSESTGIYSLVISLILIFVV